ncbi:ABC transporter permease [Candidatus Peregrinibacteria bacterium]|nr:ABC transporter permease [Candidatus Peregrinibacteria bacterium]
MMYFLEILQSALDEIRSNKMRSGLTMLGVIIGVASVVLMVAIGRGAQKTVTDRIQNMGTNLLIIQPGRPVQTDVRAFFRRFGGGGGGGSSTSTLTSDDAIALQKQVLGIRALSPEYRSSMQLIVGNQNMQTSVVGVTPSYPLVNNFDVQFGSYITEKHLEGMEKVVVLGQEVTRTLFGTQNPIGKDVRMENGIFTIVGIMEEKGQQGFSNLDDIAFIPLTTMLQRVQGTDRLTAINISVEEQEHMEQVKALVTAVLLNEHRIRAITDQDFNVLNQAEAVETLNEVTQTFTLLLGGIAAISLIVGGIGVMNIMLVSVTERTREIGIRKAIGARKSDILQQFLVESTVLSVLGGMIGILLSFGGALLINYFAGFQAIIATTSLLLALTFSIGVGILFGILPAYKAAKLNPIDALRYE